MKQLNVNEMLNNCFFSVGPGGLNDICLGGYVHAVTLKRAFLMCPTDDFQQHLQEFRAV